MSSHVCVLTGEGARGAFQAGLLDYLSEENFGYKLPFTKYIGISSGAITAFLYSHIEQGAIRQMFLEAKGMGDVFSFSLWTTLFGKGVFRAKPLKKKLSFLLKNHKKMEEEITPCVISYCEVSTGQIKYIDISPLSDEEKIKYLVRAVTIPALIHPEEENYCDAGVFEINPFSYELIHNKELESITVVAGKDFKMPDFNEKRHLFGFIDMAARALDVIMYSMMMDDFNLLVRSSPEFKHIDIKVYCYTGPEISAIDFSHSEYLYELAQDLYTLYDKSDIESLPMKE